MKLYNTLTRSIEPFTPLAPPTVTMYVCGPTVYDVPHLGHARSAYLFDVLRRYLETRGFQVRFVRNVTDVDDKIIEKARQEPGDGDLIQTCGVIAQRYLRSYHEALDRLGVGRPTEEPRAMAHVVPDMTDFISQLLINGVAYEAGGRACRAPDCQTRHGEARDVYFSVRKFPGYGRLSNRSLDELRVGERVEQDEHKQDPLDFALWKAAKPDEPAWDSPWGRGRPGWHIECSTMSTKLLGEAFDIHGGGLDLVFPHHENEMAQAQAAGKPFARCWIHNGLLMVGGEKMSKSLGNFITLDDALSRHTPDVLKLLFLSAHYRGPVDYTAETIEAANGRVTNFKYFFSQAAQERERGAAPSSGGFEQDIAQARRVFEAAMDDDLNVAEGFAALERLMKRIGGSGGRGSVIPAAEFLRERLAAAFGILSDYDPALSEPQRRRVEERTEARRRKDFKTADEIRSALQAEGIALLDKEDGTTGWAKL